MVEEAANAGSGNVIEEREGVHYISKDVLESDPGAAANLDKDFKKLVDSIIK